MKLLSRSFYLIKSIGHTQYNFIIKFDGINGLINARVGLTSANKQLKIRSYVAFSNGLQIYIWILVYKVFKKMNISAYRAIRIAFKL
jgi:hypothetical protein